MRGGGAGYCAGVGGLRGFCVARGLYLAERDSGRPAAHLREGGVIAAGFDAELDRLKGLATNSRQWLAEYQGKLAAESGLVR